MVDSIKLPVNTGNLITLEKTRVGYYDEKITLFRSVNGKCFLRRSPIKNMNYLPSKPNTTETRKVPVTDEWVAAIFEKIKNSRISVFITPSIGSGGELFTELIIDAFGFWVYYRWHGKAPDGWKVLDEIADEIYNMFYSIGN